RVPLAVASAWRHDQRGRGRGERSPQDRSVLQGAGSCAAASDPRRRVGNSLHQRRHAMSVAVIKLGVGNTASVMFALERLGARAELTDDPARIAEAERIILPGVGAAAHAMRLIERACLAPILRTFPRPLLGICLGQQLLYEKSEEGDAAGLALFPGDVV